MHPTAADTVKSGLNLLPGMGQDDTSEPDAESTDSDRPGSKSLMDTATDAADDIINTGIKAIPFF